MFLPSAGGPKNASIFFPKNSVAFKKLRCFGVALSNMAMKKSVFSKSYGTGNTF